MRIDSVSGAALRGIQNGLREVSEGAARIAGADAATGALPGADLAAAVVDLKVGERQVEASVRVFRAHDDTVGTLLDITA